MIKYRLALIGLLLATPILGFIYLIYVILVAWWLWIFIGQKAFDFNGKLDDFIYELDDFTYKVLYKKKN